MTNKNPGCEEALRLLAEYLDSELNHTLSDEVERHLETCRSCCSRADFERHLRSQLESIGKRELQPAFALRIRNLVDELTSAEGTDSSAH